MAHAGSALYSYLLSTTSGGGSGRCVYIQPADYSCLRSTFSRPDRRALHSAHSGSGGSRRLERSVKHSRRQDDLEERIGVLSFRNFRISLSTSNASKLMDQKWQNPKLIFSSTIYEYVLRLFFSLNASFTYHS